MVRFWHLSAEDLSIVEERRREHNRLGFAVQLCLLRYPGWPLRPDERPPQNLVEFVARQIGADPAEMETSPAWAETRREHLVLLQKVFRYRPYGSSDSGSLRAYLQTEALATDSAFTLVQLAMEWLRERKVILPALTTLESLVGRSNVRLMGGWPMA